MKVMRRFPAATAVVLVLAVVAAGLSCARKPQGPSYATILKMFADPPAEYRSAPLWVWNDKMTREEIKRELEDFKARGIGGAFIHPRPGLITPYLSDEWFSLCAYAVEVGKGLGLKIWLYDENSYPSGFAGGGPSNFRILSPERPASGMAAGTWPPANPDG